MITKPSRKAARRLPANQTKERQIMKQGDFVTTYGLTQYLIFSRQNNQLYTFVTKSFGGGGTVAWLVSDSKRKHQELITIGERQVLEDEHLLPSQNIYPCKLSREEIEDKFRVYPSRVGLLS